MIQFYCPDIETNPVLPESDSGHAVRVLRLRAGDSLQIVDGRGGRFTARLVDPHPKHAMVEIVGREEVVLPWTNRITVAVAPTKNMDRMEWLVEKLTEIGINRFIPVRCQHSERKEIKQERLEKIAVSAMKQSLKAVLPEIWPMTPVREVLEMDVAQRFIAYCDPSIPRRLLAREYRPGLDALFLIGPEGDFSPEEIRSALERGFTPVSLGDNRLRTETAALVAADTAQILNLLAQGTQA